MLGNPSNDGGSEKPQSRSPHAQKVGSALLISSKPYLLYMVTLSRVRVTTYRIFFFKVFLIFFKAKSKKKKNNNNKLTFLTCEQ
jgi:hypothetical protein